MKKILTLAVSSIVLAGSVAYAENTAPTAPVVDNAQQAQIAPNNSFDVADNSAQQDKVAKVVGKNAEGNDQVATVAPNGQLKAE